MGLFSWINSRIKNIDMWDIGLIKLAVAAFVLMAAKLWSPLLSLDWYWYVLVVVAAAIRPVMRILK